MERWNGSVAVVTGASSGIGLATAQQLVLHGLIVIGLARRLNKMTEGMKDVKGPGQFHARECDITNETNVIEAFDWIKNEFKAPQILINNAGFITLKRIEDTPSKDMENAFKVNVFGLLYCSKQAIPMMRQSQTDAHIVNLNSISGHKVRKYTLGVYPATKYAVTALTEILKNELSDSRVRVTSISPGAVNTNMFGQILTEHSFLNGTPELRPEDIADAIVYALSVPPHVQIDEITLAAMGA